MGKKYETDITDEQWEVIAPLLHDAKIGYPATGLVAFTYPKLKKSAGMAAIAGFLFNTSACG